MAQVAGSISALDLLPLRMSCVLVTTRLRLLPP